MEVRQAASSLVLAVIMIKSQEAAHFLRQYYRIGIAFAALFDILGHVFIVVVHVRFDLSSPLVHSFHFSLEMVDAAFLLKVLMVKNVLSGSNSIVILLYDQRGRKRLLALPFLLQLVHPLR